jgi:hypothetical protein
MFKNSNDQYYEEESEFRNPLSAEFFQAKQELYEEHMAAMEANPEGDDETTFNDELNNRFDDALENFLQNFVKNGLTIRGNFILVHINGLEIILSLFYIIKIIQLKI